MEIAPPDIAQLSDWGGGGGWLEGNYPPIGLINK